MIKRGRPTKYENDKTIKKAEEYIKLCIDEIESIVESENDKTGRVRYISKLKVKLPKAEGLALYLGVQRDTLYEWASKYEDFSYILEKINQIQADRVIDEALAGNYNANIAKLLLGKHGYKDQSETDITSKGERIIGIEYFEPNDSRKKNTNQTDLETASSLPET